MNSQDLSLRLQKVAEFIPLKARLADIGSDHAYLPVALLLAGKISFAVAGEVVIGPFNAAKKQVAKNGLDNQIAVRLADGLEAIEAADQISAVTICGMGGVLIRDILKAGVERLTGEERLILQPNVAERQLRQWLASQGYQIVAEAILAENNKTYEIVVAEKNASVVYSEKELFFGPHLMQEKNAVFIEKWQRKLAKSQKILASLQAGQQTEAKIAAIKEEIQWIEEVLAEC